MTDPLACPECGGTNVLYVAVDRGVTVDDDLVVHPSDDIEITEFRCWDCDPEEPT